MFLALQSMQVHKRPFGMDSSEASSSCTVTELTDLTVTNNLYELRRSLPKKQPVSPEDVQSDYNAVEYCVASKGMLCTMTLVHFTKLCNCYCLYCDSVTSARRPDRIVSYKGDYSILNCVPCCTNSNVGKNLFHLMHTWDISLFQKDDPSYDGDRAKGTLIQMMNQWTEMVSRRNNTLAFMMTMNRSRTTERCY